MSTTDDIEREVPHSRPAQESDSEHSQTSVLEEFNPGWRFVAAFVSLCVITLMAALDATSLSVALPVIARALHGSAIEAFWSGTSFLLTSTIFQPVIGAFSHIFGRKSMIYISLAFFTAGAIMAAVANNLTLILIARSIQGIGGGGIICLTELVLVDTVPLRERGKWFSGFGAMWSVGTVAGPLLGGGFSQNVSWRWIFWINLPFIGIGLALITFFLKLHQKRGSFLSKLAQMDWFGMALFIASATGFLIPITWGGVQYPWNSWRTLVPLIVCAAGLIGFVVHIEWIAKNPLIRTSVFKNLSAAMLFAETVFHGIILWSLLYYLPLYFEAVRGFGPILAGVAMCPWTFTVAPASVAAGIVISVTGKYNWANRAGWFFATLGCGLVILLKPDTSTVAWIFLNLVGGVGTGILFPSMALAVQATATSKDQAYAANVFSFFRSLGQTFGVAIGGVIFQNQMKKQLLTYPLLANMATEYSKDAAGLVGIIKQMPDGLMKDQLKESYNDALRHVWIVMTVFAGVGLLSSFLVKQYDMNAALETEMGFKDKERVKDVEEEEEQQQ